MPHVSLLIPILIINAFTITSHDLVIADYTSRYNGSTLFVHGMGRIMW